MANIDVQYIDADGLVPVYTAAAAGGDALQLKDNAFAHFKNSSAAPITVTLVTPGTQEGLAVADRTLSVPATGEAMISLSKQAYSDPNTGRATTTYSAAAGLTVAVLSRA